MFFSFLLIMDHMMVCKIWACPRSDEPTVRDLSFDSADCVSSYSPSLACWFDGSQSAHSSALFPGSDEAPMDFISKHQCMLLLELSGLFWGALQMQVRIVRGEATPSLNSILRKPLSTTDRSGIVLIWL